MKLSTSTERVDHLIALDRWVTPLLYEQVGGEFRHRRMLRQGLNLIATSLAEYDERAAGDMLHTFVLHQLGRGGLSLHAFEAWPSYAPHVAVLPAPPQQIERPLDDLANSYGDVRRATINMQGECEHNSAHVVHLTALALPYAAEYHPELDQSKIALYCWVHDILEAYTDDVPSHGLTREQQAKRDADERSALAHLVATYGKRWPALVQIVSDYEHRVDPETRFVKTFDKLDPAYTHLENEGLQLREYYRHKNLESFLAGVAKDTERIQPYGTEFPRVMEDRLELTQRIIEVTRWADSTNS